MTATPELDINRRCGPRGGLGQGTQRAATFAVGAALPLAVTALVPALVSSQRLIASVAGASLVFLAVLGYISARAGGADVLTGAWRVTLWGALAMAITAGAGALFGAVA